MLLFVLVQSAQDDNLPVQALRLVVGQDLDPSGAVVELLVGLVILEEGKEPADVGLGAKDRGLVRILVRRLPEQVQASAPGIRVPPLPADAHQVETGDDLVDPVRDGMGAEHLREALQGRVVAQVVLPLCDPVRQRREALVRDELPDFGPALFPVDPFGETEDGQYQGDFGRLQETLRIHEARRDSLLHQGLADIRRLGTRPGEDGDVVQPVVLDKLRVAGQRAHESGHAFGIQGFLRADGRNLHVIERIPRRVHFLGIRLQTHMLLFDDILRIAEGFLERLDKDFVRGPDQLGRRSAGGVQHLGRVAVLIFLETGQRIFVLLRFREGSDQLGDQAGVAAGETVDGLLAVAHEPGLLDQRGQDAVDPGLDGIGILEFVHEQVIHGRPDIFLDFRHPEQGQELRLHIGVVDDAGLSLDLFIGGRPVIHNLEKTILDRVEQFAFRRHQDSGQPFGGCRDLLFCSGDLRIILVFLGTLFSVHGNRPAPAQFLDFFQPTYVDFIRVESQDSINLAAVRFECLLSGFGRILSDNVLETAILVETVLHLLEIYIIAALMERIVEQQPRVTLVVETVILGLGLVLVLAYLVEQSLQDVLPEIIVVPVIPVRDSEGFDILVEEGFLLPRHNVFQGPVHQDVGNAFADRTDVRGETQQVPVPVDVAARDRVQGAHQGAVHPDRVVRGQLRLALLPEFRGGRIGEGGENHPLRLGAFADELRDDVDDPGGLAGPGAGGDMMDVFELVHN